MFKKLCLFFAFLLMYSNQSFANTFIVGSEDEYNVAIEMAKEESKNIILIFTSDNCSWCKKQKEILSEEKISKELQKYIVAYINVPKNRSIAKKYNVSSVPKCVMIDKNEKILKELNGYKKDFLKWLE